MNRNGLPNVVEQKRVASPTSTPQALVWDGRTFWMSSRDLGTLYKIDPPSRRSGAAGIERGKIVDEIDPPGIVWSGVALGEGEMRFNIGKGLNDDRYIYRYTPKGGF